MRIPVSWLRTFTEIPSDLDALSSMCDMAGLEVATIDHIGKAWDKIVVGKVLSAEAVEGTHLTSVQLDLGPHGQRHSMCGAANMGPDRVGSLVAAAIEGAAFQVKNKDGSTGSITVVPREVQGRPSEVVLCSEQELGLSDNHDGIFYVEKEAAAGTPIVDLYGDSIIEFDLTPDLGRCFSVYGTAREIAALLGNSVNKETMKLHDSGRAGAGSVPVRIEEPNLCNRYLGAVIHGVKVAPSPEWMQLRLIGAGLRPLNNIVDISNYVLLEMGQPLHFFDLQKLSGPAVSVRLAREGESLPALNGQTYTLSEKALVIADEKGAIAVAGIIGGEQSSVTDDTESVLLEAAHFNNHSVRRTAAAIKLRTDAAERFIKDLDPAWTHAAMERAIELVLELCPGARLEGYQDAYPLPPTPKSLQLSEHDVQRLLGVPLSATTIQETLARFDFSIEVDGDTMQVLAPTYRKDVTCTADLIEEVARAYGLNNIPPSTTGTSYLNQSTFGEELIHVEDTLSAVLCGLGFVEAINYSISGEKWNAFGSHFGSPSKKAVTLLNAQSVDRSGMRMTLIPGLLDNIGANLRYQSGVHLYELGRTYFDVSGTVEELDMLAFVSTGSRRAPFWGEQELGSAFGLEYNLFDMKGILDATLARIGISGLEYKAMEVESLTPGQTFGLYLEDECIGYLGEVDPDISKEFDIEDRRVYAAEIRLSPLMEARQKHTLTFTPLATQPGTSRDLSLLVSKEIPVHQILATAQAAAGDLLEDIHLFDRYTGQGVDRAQHSLAMSLTFRHKERTLRAEEVDAFVSQVIDALHGTHGATLRS